MEIYINPPPPGGKCECCGEMEPLTKTFRRMGTLSIADQHIMDQIGGSETIEEAKKRLGPKYGAKNVGEIMEAEGVLSTTSASWECEECFPLSNQEYNRMRNERR